MAREYHVAKYGNDKNDGTKESPCPLEHVVGRDVRFAIYSARNVPQDLRRYQRAVKSGHAERSSYCCWLSQRGSNWIKTQFCAQE